jgi:hypothetical protein
VQSLSPSGSFFTLCHTVIKPSTHREKSLSLSTATEESRCRRYLNVRQSSADFQPWISCFILHLVILSLARSAFASPTDDCLIPADPDILGLGVRLGIYLRTASNIFLGLARPDEASGSLPTTNIFMTGIFVAVLHSMANDGYTAGSMICMLSLLVFDLLLLGPTLLIAVAHSKKVLTVSYITVGITICRWIAFTGFNTWFWFHGLSVQNDAQCQEARLFFFTNLSFLLVRLLRGTGCQR